MDEALKEHGFSSISATEGDENQTEEKKEETFNKKKFCCEKHYKLFEQASRSIRYYYKSASRPFIKRVETSLRQSFEISTSHKPSQWLPDQFCRLDINWIQTNRQADCNFKWPAIYRVACSIYNGTLKYFIWSSINYISMFIILKTGDFQLWFLYWSNLRNLLQENNLEIIRTIHVFQAAKTTLSPTLLIR